MTVERIVLIVAGFFIMLCCAGRGSQPAVPKCELAVVHRFVGFNLFQSGFTRFCPMHIMLKKIGVKESCHFYDSWCYRHDRFPHPSPLPLAGEGDYCVAGATLTLTRSSTWMHSFCRTTSCW